MMLLQAWVLFVMLSLVPQAEWQDSFDQTAIDIGTESWENPIHGPGSEYETASYLLAFGFTESRYNPETLGDCPKGQEPSVSACQSFGLFQVSKAHAPARDLLQSGPAAMHASRLLKQSMSICRKERPEHRFAWYAKGGPDCSPKGFEASAYRYRLAQRIVREYSLP
jgi:hypothetical protein